ncbi:uncharacterized protein J7T54_005853 [Emericellopsis cladophorae]|uniref:FAD-binding PCMH-type domain-containing protein n=1 Tax=Emericellopsis cladophorae TaxID=2686198 RepID=A0A9P9XVY1_9HYPO|nr:uncharacterized protein J7T54_005853 [Emericellopsis cladophorae]KAI6778750.1 hypothetical protein J7T54_005853 [Emericellopsis cladophorae]
MFFPRMLASAALASVSLAGSVAFPALCDKFDAAVSSSSFVKCGVAPERWSEYEEPQPGAIITVGKEDDVAKIVQVANAFKVEYLVQSGATGWADTFTLGRTGIIIDVSQLKSISFNKDKTQVTFQSGVLIEDLVGAAYNNDARVATGTCNCVSVLGAGLGGGVGRGTGMYGLGSDQLLKVNLVDANGKKVTVTPTSNPDLWWALNGAGPNFGIVTSVVYKSYPMPQDQNTAWTGLLPYDSSKLEQVIAAIDKLDFEPEMQLDFYFTQGQLAVLPFYLGSEEQGRKKFASILDIGPLADDTAVIPFNTWNAAGDMFCARGGRKPAYTANMQTLDPTAWRNAWNDYLSFYQTYPEANQTTILTECYSTAKNLEIGGAKSAYPWRDIKCYAIVIPWYTSPSLDVQANDFAKRLRHLWYNSSGTSASSYVNFAHGDEPLSNIYGGSLAKLQRLKKQYDPKGKFNEWFPLS